MQFLESLQNHYEIIAWTSSQSDYTHLLVDVIQKTLNFKFDYFLSLSDQTPSEEKEFFAKNLEILTGYGSRTNQDIIIVDCQMSSFTKSLTNGVFLPSYRIHEDKNDFILNSLQNYLLSFVMLEVIDVRSKIKLDFEMLKKFNGLK